MRKPLHLVAPDLGDSFKPVSSFETVPLRYYSMPIASASAAIYTSSTSPPRLRNRKETRKIQTSFGHKLKVSTDRWSNGPFLPDFLVRSAHFVHSIDSKSQTSFKKFLVDLLWTCQKDYCHRRLIWNLLLTNLVDFKSFRHTPLTIWERSNAFVEQFILDLIIIE